MGDVKGLVPFSVHVPALHPYVDEAEILLQSNLSIVEKERFKEGNITHIRFEARGSTLVDRI